MLRGRKSWVALACWLLASGCSLMVGFDDLSFEASGGGGAGGVGSCADGLLSPGESDVDCGGPCPACDLGERCVEPSDCGAAVCVDGMCCDEACDGVCQACGGDGRCTPTPAGEDPGGECSHEHGYSSCSGDGACFGDLVFSTLVSSEALIESDAMAFRDVVLVAGGDVIGVRTSGSAVGSVAMVARLGDVKWNSTLGTTSVRGRGVALTSNGDVIVAGSAGLGATFDCATSVTHEESDRQIFIARLSATDGSCEEVVLLGGSGDEEAHDVAVGPDGAIYVAGRYEGEMVVNGIALEEAGGGDGFVFRLNELDAGGVVPWVVRWSGPTPDTATPPEAASQEVRRIDLRDGKLAMVGATDGPAVFFHHSHGASQASCVVSGDASERAFAALVDAAAGVPAWCTGLGATGGSEANGVAIEPTGSVLVAGAFAGALHDESEIERVAGAGMKDAYLAILAETDGAMIDAHGFGSSARDEAHAVAVDGQGKIVVVGALGGTADLGGGVIEIGGPGAVFMAGLDLQGRHLFSFAFPTDGFFIGAHAATWQGARIAIGGVAGEAINFGEPLTSSGTTHAFLAAFEP